MITPADIRPIIKRLCIRWRNRRVEAINSWARNYVIKCEIEDRSYERALLVPGNPKAERVVTVYLILLIVTMVYALFVNLFGLVIPLATPSLDSVKHAEFLD